MLLVSETVSLDNSLLKAGIPSVSVIEHQVIH